jgi:hypothetical protein
MKYGSVFRKSFHGFLGVLYLSLSFYAISCAFHHDLLTHPAGEDIHHAHGHETDSSSKPSLDNTLLCKFARKLAGSVVLVSAPQASWLGVSSQEMVLSGFSAPAPVFGDHSGRAPPISILI